MCYFYVDYETYPAPLPDAAHLPRAVAARESDRRLGPDRCGRAARAARRIGEAWRRPNLDGAGNYVILEAQGRGHYVGCNLNIDVFERQQNDWYGEGDDMIWIDGELAHPGHGHRGLLQHRVQPGHGLQRAVSRPAGVLGHGRVAVVRQELDVPLAHRGPDPLPRVDQGDDRARPRERPLERLLQHRVLVPDAPARRPPPLLPADASGYLAA